MANDRSRPSVLAGESNERWWALFWLSVAELWRVEGSAVIPSRTPASIDEFVSVRSIISVHEVLPGPSMPPESIVNRVI